jgi:hypothetical protein
MCVWVIGTYAYWMLLHHGQTVMYRIEEGKLTDAYSTRNIPWLISDWRRALEHAVNTHDWLTDQEMDELVKMYNERNDTAVESEPEDEPNV